MGTLFRTNSSMTELAWRFWIHRRGPAGTISPPEGSVPKAWCRLSLGSTSDGSTRRPRSASSAQHGGQGGLAHPALPRHHHQLPLGESFQGGHGASYSR